MNMPSPSETELYSRLDLAFAHFLGQRTGLAAAQKKAFETVLATLSQQQHQGHTCIKITEAEKQLALDSGFACELPAQSPQSYPLVIEQGRLYLQRYWHYEDRLARQIKRLSLVEFKPDPLGNLLDRYFPPQTEATDWQREAATVACQRAFCIITGGPGTGKTTTVSKILAIQQALAATPLLIALAAPTGKAAMRLQEAVASTLAGLDCPAARVEHIPRTAVTLHRLLGALPPSPYFRHDASNPLSHDLVVVDEASMVDLALMSKLVDALKPEARLILLGDKDQLASVESGAILANLIAALPGNTVELQHAYRFNEGIKHLADAVNKKDHEAAWALLSDGSEATGLIKPEQLMSYIVEQRKGYASLVKAKAGFEVIYQAFNRFQVLCSNRHGKHGALAISASIEQALLGQTGRYNAASWYPGRPVMVLQNHPTLGLYNGDIGLCLPEAEQKNNLMVYFQRPDGSIKKYLPARMPAYETVFAMTIHKVQGSEFDEVLIVLPETANPVLSKELVYTAITRARNKINLVAGHEVFNAALARSVGRMSGLVEKIS
jgi:exodeoxyribonuclease V alpha subunit